MLHDLSSNNGCGDAANSADSRKKNKRQVQEESEFDNRISSGIRSEEFQKKLRSSFMAGDHQKIPEIDAQSQSRDENGASLDIIITNNDRQRTPEQRGKPVPPPGQANFEWSPKIIRNKRIIIDRTHSFPKINFDVI